MSWKLSRGSAGLLLMGILLGLAAAGCQTSTGKPAAPGALTGKLLFRSRVRDLGMQTGSLAAGKSPEEAVEITLPGRLYEPPQEVGETSKETADRSTPFHAAVSDYSAFRASDGDWILENFSDDDRAEILATLAQRETRDAVRKVFRALGSMQVWGEARWENYRLVLARYNGDSEGGVILTFRETPEGWKRTNALRSDETFDAIFSAFRSGTVKPAE